MASAISDRLAQTQATAPLAFDSAILLLIRGTLVVGCSRFLRATLSPALRLVSREETLVLLQDEDEDEDSATSYASPLVSPLVSPPHPYPSREPYARQLSDLNLSNVGGSSGNASSSSNVPSQRPPMPHRTSSGPGTSPRRGREVILPLLPGGDGSSSRSRERKKSINGRTSRAIFALCFSESCMLFILVLFQSLGLLHAQSRKLHWDVSLHLIVGLLLLAIPLMQSYILTRSRDWTGVRTSRRMSLARMALLLVPFSLWSFGFACVPIPKSMVTDGGMMSASLARFGVLGVLVLGALSGFGSIMTARMFLDRMSRSSWKPISHEDVISAERSLYRTRQDLVDKRGELRRLDPSADRPYGWTGRIFGGVFGHESASSALMQEIAGLEMMESSVSKSLEAMKHRKKRMEFSKTFAGRLWNGAGYIFAAYCVCRLLMAIFNLFIWPRLFSPSDIATTVPLPTMGSSSPSNGTRGATPFPDPSSTLNTSTTTHQPSTDWISYLLAIGLSHLPFDVDVPLLSRQISFALVGLIIASSIQYVLKSVARVLRLGGTSAGGGMLLLGLAQVMALYLLSLLIQLRTYLPPPDNPDTPDEGGLLVSSLPTFTAFNQLFDIAYLVAGMATLFVAWLDAKVNRSPGDADIWRMEDV